MKFNHFLHDFPPVPLFSIGREVKNDKISYSGLQGNEVG